MLPERRLKRRPEVHRARQRARCRRSTSLSAQQLFDFAWLSLCALSDARVIWNFASVNAPYFATDRLEGPRPATGGDRDLHLRFARCTIGANADANPLVVDASIYAVARIVAP